MTFAWISSSFAEGNKDATMGLGTGCLFIFGPCLIWTLYQRYVSDLSDIPGPFIASITRFWHVCVILQGKQNLSIKALHEKHGPFVRIAPNEVSVCHPDGSSKLLRESHEKVGPPDPQNRPCAHTNSTAVCRETGTALRQFRTSGSRTPCPQPIRTGRRVFLNTSPPPILRSM